MRLLSPTRVLRAAAQPSKSFADTLHLPRSSFPARASPDDILKYQKRCAQDLYAWQRQARFRNGRDGSGGGEGTGGSSKPDFVLHDGPPYANGAVHVGHALNKVLKDLILRWELAKGKRVHYRPGWDCHGLPIELKALQQQRTKQNEAKSLIDSPEQEAATATGQSTSAVEIRSKARQLATQTVEMQRESFRGWGVMGEWDAPYKTMDHGFEIKQLGVFAEMVKKGLISRHHRPVYWSPSSRTALAEAELEYDDHHKCMAAFVKMPFVNLPGTLKDLPAIKSDAISALIWTTTPWTLPANKAIAVKDDIAYCVIELQSSESGVTSGEQLVVAIDRLEHILTYLPEGTTVKTILERIRGSELAAGRPICFNIFQGTESPILIADFVTATSGTGLVHMAPGHGMEDYQVCQANGVGPAFAPIDENGRYTSEVFPADEQDNLLDGLDAQTDGAKTVLLLLETPQRYLPPHVHTHGSSLLLAAHSFVHKNPIDWRTKQPVVVRATAQWFADVSAIKDRATAALENVTFIPESGKTRLSAFVSGRSQWCISRQRAWGLPIPALYRQDTGEACITDESIAHIISVIEQRGTDAWFSDADDDAAWLHSSLKPGEWVRGKDTMDVWFDSGTTWTTLPSRENEQISDVYVEGTDQHRGWFQSSLLTHVAVQDANATPRAPYAKLITHGFTLDAEGRKMSKSIGNVIAPEHIIDGSLLPPIKPKKQKAKGGNVRQSDPSQPVYDSLGPDALRLWVASSDYTRDVSIAVPVLQEVQEALKKYRVTFKFLLGVLADYKPHGAEITAGFNAAKLSFADEAILHRLARTSEAVHRAYSDYEFHKGVKEINALIYSDLSSFYFEICKDRVYAGESAIRRRTQAVLHTIMQELLKMLGPVVPHLVEEVWEHMPQQLKSTNNDEADVALHPLRQVWNEPYLSPTDEVVMQDELDRKLADFRALSEATKLAQETARREGHLKSGLACKVVIDLPDRQSEFAQRVLAWEQSGELADLLVVSQAETRPSAKAGIESTTPVWQHQSAVAGDSEASGCIVTVLPPDGQKCIRCWKYTAEDEHVPCDRCLTVLEEQSATTV